MSGVAATHYRVDGAAWRTGTSVLVSGDGVHTLEFYSVDGAGNPTCPRSTARRARGPEGPRTHRSSRTSFSLARSSICTPIL